MFGFDVDDEFRIALFEHHHAGLLYPLVDANRGRLARWMPWAWEASPESTRDFVARGLEKFARGDGFEAGIWSGGELAGAIGLHYLDRVAAATEIGYWLAFAFEGRGVMTRSVAATCRVLFEEYGLRRAEIRCDPDNARSRAVPTRLGFREEGIATRPGGAERHVIYGLLVEDWQGWE